MHQPASVLLIDDSPGECELFELALAASGIPATIALEQDPQVALLTLRNSPPRHLPSLILLDWKLGAGHGDRFLHALRGIPHLAVLPVVIFSTSAEDQDVAAGYGAGATGYVQKPLTFDQLVLCIQDLCRYWLRRNLMPGMVKSPC